MGRRGSNEVAGTLARLFWRLSAGSGAGRPRGLLRVWPIWERAARRIWPTRDIPGAPYGIFGVHLTHYRGQTFALPDGALVRKGDRVAEIHANGSAVLAAARESKWRVLTAASRDLQAIAAWIVTAPDMSDVKAFYAITMLETGARRLGFSSRPRKITWRTRLDRFFLMGLLVLYTEEGAERLAIGTTAVGFPQEAWMSREELLRRYG